MPATLARWYWLALILRVGAAAYAAAFSAVLNDTR